MRAESRAGSVLRFWALRLDAWCPPLLAVAAAAWLPRASRFLPPEAGLLSAGLLAVGVAFLGRSFLTVTDPPRAALAPGWVRIHRRWFLGLTVAGAAAVAGSLHLFLLPLSASVMLAALSVAVGFTIAAEMPDRLTGVKRVEVGLLTWLVFGAAVVGLPLVVWFLSSDFPLRWWVEHEPAVRRGWHDLFRSEHPLAAVGVVAASSLITGLSLASMGRRSRSLFQRRPFAPTFAVRKGPREELVRGRTAPASPAPSPSPSPLLRKPSWGLGRTAGSSLGRVSLFLQHLSLGSIPFVWLVLCPFCVWFQWNVRPSSVEENRMKFLGATIGLIGFGSLLTASAANRLLKSTAEAKSLPRSVLFPRTRAEALRVKLLSMGATVAPGALALVLFLGSVSLFDAKPADLVVWAAASLACFAALTLWFTAVRFTEQFPRRGWRIGLVAVFLSVWASACAVDGRDIPGHDGEPDARFFLLLGSFLIPPGLLACGLVLRLSHRWDLTTR